MEKVSAPVATLERRPSLEEPLTLSTKELTSLREAALEVINNHTKEEAEKIFLVGLEPVKTKPKERKVLGKRTRH